ncbi:MAG TPA: 2-amino-4-hydroxy-6-hydroxymethyldihydropteridine diphosphokinase [Longimicrobiales bacterium]
MRTFIGLGSNVGDRGANLRRAVMLLRRQMAVVAVSSIYESDPVGYTDQPRFWNMVVQVETDLSPRALLECLIGIEQEMGRERSFRNAPRNIDLDILLHDDVVMDEPGLNIPHPRIAQRAFVLKPLLELAPDLVDPASGQRYRDILRAGQFAYAESVGPFEE